MSTLFTKIIKREIPSDILYEDEEIFVIKDIHPKSKTHLLIIPRKEIPTINDIDKSDRDLIWNMFLVAKKISRDLWISEWYKLKFNVWEKWWQEIMHIHLHLLSDL